METINSVAAAAAKVVWGDNTQQQQHGEEPVSGETGNTAKGEPYDAGNLDEPKNKTNGSAGQNSSAEFAKSTGTAVTSDETPDNPSTNLKAKDVPEDTTQGQNDVRDPDDPQTNPKLAPTDVDNTGHGPNKAQKLDGPGPKPLDEVAKHYGGAAGTEETTSLSGGKEPTSVVSRTSRTGNDDFDGPNAKSKGEGTGEKHARSSGLLADGGDFDVAKPGAGHEAERLKEEKGIHHRKDVITNEEESSEPKDGEKKKLSQKIKDKLHRH